MKDYTPSEQPSPPINYHVNELGAVVTGANILVSAVLIGAIYFDNRSATIAALSGIVYFSMSTSLTLLTLSGSLSQMVTNHQQQVTMRRLHQLQFHAQPSRLRVVEGLQSPYTESMQLAENTRFVAPHDADEGARREAAAWILQLYGADGQPDPKKVLMQSDKERPGRVRIAAPSRPAKQYLMDKHILLDLGTGFRLNVVRCPTIEAAQDHLV